MTDRYFQTAEVAVRLGVGEKTLRNKVSAGIFRLGKHCFRIRGVGTRRKWEAIVESIESEQVCLLELPCRFGIIDSQGGSLLAACTDRPQIGARLRTLDCIRSARGAELGRPTTVAALKRAAQEHPEIGDYVLKLMQGATLVSAAGDEETYKATVAGMIAVLHDLRMRDRRRLSGAKPLSVVHRSREGLTG